MTPVVTEPLAIIPVGNELGEGVLWDSREEAFWWTDIESHSLFRYRLYSAELDQFPTPERLACFARVRGRPELVCGFETGFAFFEPETGRIAWLKEQPTLPPTVRLNDGRADRQGRFWAGGMVEDPSCAPGGSSLYRLDREMHLVSCLDSLTISNGLCWSPDSRWLYHADTPKRRIDRYAFDAGSGDLGAGEVFARTDKGCYPDGATIDKLGGLWSAQWGSSRVLRYTACGDVSDVLELPVPQPSCVSFGGRDLNVLAVTSARQGLSAAALSAAPHSGDLFLFETSFTGIQDPEFAPGNATTETPHSRKD